MPPTMLSNKPYILRAFYQWIIDSECNPYLLVQADFPDVLVPEQHIDKENKITLNASPRATRDFKITNEHISFLASFSGVTHEIFVPLPAVLAIYAAENGEGMVFEEESPKDYLSAKKHTQRTEKSTKPGSVPYLRLVEDDEDQEDE